VTEPKPPTPGAPRRDPEPALAPAAQQAAPPLHPGFWRRHRTNVGVIAGVIAAIAAVVGVVIGLGSPSNGGRGATLSSAPGAGAGQVYAALEPGLYGEAVTEVHGQPVTYIDLYNSTGAPVFKAIVSLVFIQGLGWRTGKQLAQMPQTASEYQRAVQIIPTGRSRIHIYGGWGTLAARPGVEIAYRDESGRSWLRTADGRLESIREDPSGYYGLTTPLDWIVPQPLS
jgi:hypothetical protein